MDRTSKRDLQGLAFIRNTIMHSGVTPSLREIARVVGYNSPRSVQLMLERLEKQGLLKRVNGVIKLSPKRPLAVTEQTVEIPLVGSVACGLPTLAEQEPETIIDVSTKLARPGSRYFLLRANGTSMNRAGINDGDLVLVRQQPTADQGEKVVALINDDATIKRFYHEGDVVVLKPDSSDKSHKPIVLSEEFEIQGVVAAVLPRSLY
jgi:repressor LexA